MNIGETIETAIWIDGSETPALRARLKKHATDFLDELCDLAHVLHGPVRWTVLRPGDNRVPAVPVHKQGPDVRLLVAEADIVANRPQLSTRSFVGDLDRLDLERLRESTRKAHARHFRGRRLTDMECDDIIDELGPDAAMEAIRRAVNNGTVH